VLLCAVDEAPDHNISIWDWQRGERGQKITETKVQGCFNGCSSNELLTHFVHPSPTHPPSIITCAHLYIIISYGNVEFMVRLVLFSSIILLSNFHSEVLQ